jgi:hypothetical protein
MGHGGLTADVHDRIPISIPIIDQFKRQLDKIFDTLPLYNNFLYRQQKKRFVRNAVVGKRN